MESSNITGMVTATKHKGCFVAVAVSPPFVNITMIFQGSYIFQKKKPGEVRAGSRELLQDIFDDLCDWT